LPLQSTDVSGSVSSRTYDGLGRLTAVWEPNKSVAAGAPANLLYAYAPRATGPTVVTTQSLQDNADGGTTANYTVNKVLYDALQRPLETQSTGENGSTVVSDTQYDSHGWTVLTDDAYAIAVIPAPPLSCALFLAPATTSLQGLTAAEFAGGIVIPAPT
jgi:hypothetical protein